MAEETQSTQVGTAPEDVTTEVASDQSAGTTEDAGNQGEQLVTVKIDGVEKQVPLSEAIAGYQRQADYTRKSQTVAQREQELAQADALYQAFQADPHGTLALLEQQFASLQDNGDFSDEEPDPVAVKLAEHDQFIQQQREAAAVQQVNDEIARLQQQYGQFDRDALLQHAIDNGGLPLDVALIHMRAVNGEAERQRQDQAALQAKQQAFQPAGGSTAQGSSGRRSDGPPKSIKEALHAALDEAGLTALPPIDAY